MRSKRIETRMVTKEELAVALETVMVLSNNGAVHQMEGSKADIAGGRTRPIALARDAL